MLHHVPWPEVVLAEMTRATRPGGRLLVIDQLAPFDPLTAIELDRFERDARSVPQRGCSPTATSARCSR